MRLLVILAGLLLLAACIPGDSQTSQDPRHILNYTGEEGTYRIMQNTQVGGMNVQLELPGDHADEFEANCRELSDILFGDDHISILEERWAAMDMNMQSDAGNAQGHLPVDEFDMRWASVRVQTDEQVLSCKIDAHGISYN